MSVVQETRYTCDRCKGEVVMRRDVQPTAWAEIDVHYMDRKGSDGRGLLIKTGQLCFDCRLAFITWWEASRP